MNNGSNQNFNNSLLNDAIHGIFQKNGKILADNKNKKFKGIDQKELEFALAVILVDLASCDQNFDQREYLTITQGLKRLFGTTKEEVRALINQATTSLANLRGSGQFAERLKASLDPAQKKIVMDIIEEVISADGKEDGFETYLRHKFADLLGLPLEPKAP